MLKTIGKVVGLIGFVVIILSVTVLSWQPTSTPINLGSNIPFWVGVIMLFVGMVLAVKKTSAYDIFGRRA